MTTKNTDRLRVYLLTTLKRNLKAMSEETGYTVNQLALMSLTSLNANYKQKTVPYLLIYLVQEIEKWGGFK